MHTNNMMIPPTNKQTSKKYVQHYFYNMSRRSMYSKGSLSMG